MTSTRTVPALLTRLTAAPGRPRLTWYTPDERVELSGSVLDNWVTKTANLLVEEFEACPGTCVLLDLPIHWRTVVWALAIWRVGACVAVPGATTAEVDIVVTDHPDAHPDVDVVAVALPAHARRFDTDLPDGVVDAAGAVMAYGDVLTWMPEHDPDADALVFDGPTVPHRDLGRWATDTLAAVRPYKPGARVLVTASPDTPVATVLGVIVEVLAIEGSVVLCAPGTVDDPQARRHLVDTELVTDTARL